MVDAEIVQEVTGHVQAAIKRNRRIETVLTVLVAIVAVSGMGLMWFAAANQQWVFALSGSLCEVAIGIPIRSLVKLRQENIRLEILPQLIRLAGTANEKKLVFHFISRLIDQIGS
jgi:hypothetical protein